MPRIFLAADSLGTGSLPERQAPSSAEVKPALDRFIEASIKGKIQRDALTAFFPLVLSSLHFERNDYVDSLADCRLEGGEQLTGPQQKILDKLISSNAVEGMERRLPGCKEFLADHVKTARVFGHLFRLLVNQQTLKGYAEGVTHPGDAVGKASAENYPSGSRSLGAFLASRVFNVSPALVNRDTLTEISGGNELHPDQRKYFTFTRSFCMKILGAYRSAEVALDDPLLTLGIANLFLEGERLRLIRGLYSYMQKVDTTTRRTGVDGLTISAKAATSFMRCFGIIAAGARDIHEAENEWQRDDFVKEYYTTALLARPLFLNRRQLSDSVYLSNQLEALRVLQTDNPAGLAEMVVCREICFPGMQKLSDQLRVIRGLSKLLPLKDSLAAFRLGFHLGVINKEQLEAGEKYLLPTGFIPNEEFRCRFTARAEEVAYQLDQMEASFLAQAVRSISARSDRWQMPTKLVQPVQPDPEKNKAAKEAEQKAKAAAALKFCKQLVGQSYDNQEKPQRLHILGIEDNGQPKVMIFTEGKTDRGDREFNNVVGYRPENVKEAIEAGRWLPEVPPKGCQPVIIEPDLLLTDRKINKDNRRKAKQIVSELLGQTFVNGGTRYRLVKLLPSEEKATKVEIGSLPPRARNERPLQKDLVKTAFAIQVGSWKRLISK